MLHKHTQFKFLNKLVHNELLWVAVSPFKIFLIVQLCFRISIYPRNVLCLTYIASEESLSQVLTKCITCWGMAPNTTAELGVFWAGLRHSAHAQFAILRSWAWDSASKTSRRHCLFSLRSVTVFTLLLIKYYAKPQSNRVIAQMNNSCRFKPF